MVSKNRKNFTKEEIEYAIKNSSTMGYAAKILHVDWRTFKKEAEKYNLYKPTLQSNKKFDLQDILNGLHPQYPTSKILPRLVKEKLKEYKCECCGITDWQNKRIGLELDHINGDNSDHRLENLRALCPNCHSQTDTYKSKKIRRVNQTGSGPALKAVRAAEVV